MFAILTILRREGDIIHFITNDQLQGYRIDFRLPFPRASLELIIPDLADEFYEVQWQFTAPIFSRQFHHRLLDLDTVPPFTTSKFIGQGAFGRIHEVTLHRKHHKLDHLTRDGVSKSRSAG